ncbi:hypothetical protein SAMN02746041_02774 [Desulfacinum hydrothermale DSM 13146]|uniref:Uncharacterized protein n=1 Tax=Desulfacinum hydrothermale DSM 13146 TaxID=1121390 RepID=A0A1W1XSG7_9BACT|nr:hypothetical protein [Desulfacinum hydrothermale]SMC26792.1 hypothetical protein SAMN02746041_02774 [Desulfacinum hydrothermale DSM 13146]
MPMEPMDQGLFRGTGSPMEGELGTLLARFAPDVVVGHPTFRNADNIGGELQRGIRAALQVYENRKVAFVVSDGTWTVHNPDTSTLDAALTGAAAVLAELAPEARSRLLVVATPYDGYQGDHTPGKGSALKLIFDEMAQCPSAGKLILLDGDLRNDFLPWFRVFSRVEADHGARHPGRHFFITARYARHFVDASLTRFIVGPLTTLMGRYVPGGISGDIVLSAGAVQHERDADWDDARRRYGTDIATTFDNIADPRTDIYEVYLGAKLHDITDEAKLSVMPGEVIGSALGRLLHYEERDGRVSRLLDSDQPLARPETWGPEKTGIAFIDPGTTDVFRVDVKRETLLSKFADYQDAMRAVLFPETFAALLADFQRLQQADTADDAPVVFLNLSRKRWIGILYESLAHLLVTRDVDTVKGCLNYLYTAAFLEFCREKIAQLGAVTYGQVRTMQTSLGVPPEQAEVFYRDQVDRVVERMALDFFHNRRAILDLIKRRTSSSPPPPH